MVHPAKAAGANVEACEKASSPGLTAFPRCSRRSSLGCNAAQVGHHPLKRCSRADAAKQKVSMYMSRPDFCSVCKREFHLPCMAELKAEIVESNK
jgi:hypothetical protein